MLACLQLPKSQNSKAAKGFVLGARRRSWPGLALLLLSCPFFGCREQSKLKQNPDSNLEQKAPPTQVDEPPRSGHEAPPNESREAPPYVNLDVPTISDFSRTYTPAITKQYAQKYRLPWLDRCAETKVEQPDFSNSLADCARRSLGKDLEVSSKSPLHLTWALPWDALRLDGKLSRCAKFRMSPDNIGRYPTVIFEAKIGTVNIGKTRYFAIPLAKGEYAMVLSFSPTHKLKAKAIARVKRTLLRAKKTFISLPYVRFQINRPESLSKLVDPYSYRWLFSVNMFGVSIGEGPSRKPGTKLSSKDEIQVSKGVLIDRPFSFGLWDLKNSQLIASGSFTGERQLICATR